MSIFDTNSLECSLEPLEKVQPNVEDRYVLSLKDNFNEDEVKQFVAWLGERQFAYQFGHFYDYLPTIKSSQVSTKSEYFKDYENKVNECKESFWNFSYIISGDFKNKHKSHNNGPDKLEGITWHASTSFIDIYDLPKVLFINTEDLPFTNDDASFYGRSVFGLLQQEYVSRNKELISRNFNIIKASDNKYLKSAQEMMKKQRDLILSREQVIKLLESRKCLETGKSYIDILSDDFTIVK